MQLVSIEEILNESGKNRKLIISSKYNEGTPISLDKIYKYGTNWVEYLFNCSAEQRESWLYSAIVYDGNQIKTERLTEKKKIKVIVSTFMILHIINNLLGLSKKI